MKVLFCIVFQAKLGHWVSHTPGLPHIPRDFVPGYLRSARGVFQTLLSNNSGHFQHRDAEESEILLSGFSVPLWLYPRTSSLTHGTSSQFYTLRSWRLPDAPVKQRRFIPTQRRRGIGESSLRGSPCPCGYTPGLLP